MDFDESHLYLRPVQFEFAPYKEDAGKPPPVFMTTVQEDDTMIDKCVIFITGSCDILTKTAVNVCQISHNITCLLFIFKIEISAFCYFLCIVF